MRAIGSSLPRVDAAEKVSGTADFPGDIDLPGQLWMRIVYARVPHACIKAVHTGAAKAAPGVIAVLTAADVPVNEYGLIVADQPVLCGTDSTPQAGIVRWEADHVALVIAETPDQAEAAGTLVRVDYDLLPVVTDPFEAMEPNAPILHPHAFSHFPYGHQDTNSNVLHKYRLQRGDAEIGLAQADVIVESTYRTHAQEHAYLQPEAGVAFVRPDGRIEVICAGQWMHEERRQIAHALDLPQEQVAVRFPAIGGAFGGREDISVQIALALAAQKTGRPVKIVWDREESIRGHHKRHPYTLMAKWGATVDGKIIAAQMDVTGDAGAYAYTSSKVLGNVVMACLGPYEIPNVLVDARTVYTNNCPSGAFRGFGAPQGQFAAEMQVSKLAEALGMDPVELRMRNIWREGSILPTRSVVPAGCTAAQVLEEAAKNGGWRRDGTGGWLGESSGDTRVTVPSAEPELIRTRPDPGNVMISLDSGRTRVVSGRGIAACFKNVGFSLGFPESCAAWVDLQGGAEIEKAIVACVGADVGQGAHTVFQQIAADALDIEPDRVELAVDSTEIADSSGSASASRMTFMGGNAIKGAAERALALWENEERPARAEYIFRPRSTTPYAEDTGEGNPNITHGYCAQVADIEVDLETGHVTVRRLVSVNDVGKAINPQQVEGQIEGAVAQAIGWTLLEQFIQTNGRAITAQLSTYLVPGVLDVAEVIEPIILELPDPQGPWGARGMAEMPFIPVAPAIAAAIHDATGIWMDELPFTPERIWKALKHRTLG